MYDWIVIGGGIHGCTIAIFLIKHGKVQREKLCIIDPHEEPMTRWKRNTDRISMPYLRSPSVHHMDTHPLSLLNFSTLYDDRKPFYGLYKRPSLPLFNDHSNKLIEETNLKKSWVQGRVKQLTKVGEQWSVKTESGEILFAKNVVIAISVNEQFIIPHWADPFYKLPNKQIHHIFEEELPKIDNVSPPVAIIGGGITAAHLAIKLAQEHPGDIILLKRHPFRVHDFDSDPGWLGAKFQRPYRNVKDYTQRRELIKQARWKGSIPKELLHKLKRLEAEHKLRIEDGDVTSCSQRGTVLELALENKSIQVQHVLLATGFQPSRPGDWLEKLIHEEQLQCAHCGYPIVKEDLQWCPHLYVMGPLAELEMGPIARNISGARQAAERIVASL